MIDASFCDILLTGSVPATFVWKSGRPASEISVSNRLAARNVPAADVLRAATLLTGGLTGLGVDSDLFTGALPPENRYGFALSFLGAAENQDFDFSVWDLRFYGRADSMESLFVRQGMLSAKLPLPLPVTVRAQTLSGAVLIDQMSVGKTRIESVGGGGCAGFALHVDLKVACAAG